MLGLVILNYKNYELTKNAVNNLLNNSLEVYKVIIVDNNSENLSFEILSSYYENNEKVEVIQSFENGGYAKGNNIGLKALLKYDLMFLGIMNPDVELENKETINRCINILKNNKGIASISPIMLLDDKIKYNFIAWKIPIKFADVFLTNPIFNLFYNPVKYKEFLIKCFEGCHYSEVEVLPGSFFIIKKDIFEKINFFDENTFLYCEERILAKKIKEIGMSQAILFDNFFRHNHAHKNQTFKNLKYHLKVLTDSRVYFNKTYNPNYGKIVSLIVRIMYYFNVLFLYFKNKISK